MRKRWGLIGTLITALGTAHAADETGKYYLSPQVGFLGTDHDRGVDDDVYYGLGFGKHVSNEWSVELNALTGSYDNEFGSGDLDITAISIDALRVFKRASKISPFVSAGIGYISDDFNPGDREDAPLAQAGVGLLIDVAENASGSFVFQLRPEIKGRLDFFDQGPVDDFFDYFAGVGFTFAFGSPKPAPSIEPKPAPAPVQQAAPEPAPEPPPPPRDSDGDGVLDPSDQCPGTPRGTAVDANGCPRKGSITLRGVNFDFNAATLTADSRPVLDTVAADLKRYPRLKVEVQGHTDSKGADAYNLNLSQRRAASVREYLISQGVSADQLAAKGYGETQPIADNNTDAGRAENRRVVLSVLDNPGDIDIKEQK